MQLCLVFSMAPGHFQPNIGSTLGQAQSFYPIYINFYPARTRCTNTTNTNIGTTNFTITSTEASIITNTTAHQALTPLAQTSTAPAPIPPAASTPQQTAAPKYKYQHQNPTIISTTSPSIITTANSNTFRKTPLAISLPASPPPPSP
ncbi:hypothetical protein BgiBS90_008496 [Biomphalaria glabrata]|nr:hypothetical protein BgiBS90_008496 [Biomphalaria glabrata]